MSSKAWSFPNTLERLMQQERPPECPPCFDCHLKSFPCVHFSKCSDLNGKCASCPIGFGGDDCSNPLCDSLAAGDERHQKPAGQQYCECADGWFGNNCNVCRRDSVCDSMMIGGQNGTCHTSSLVMNENFMQCQVTNEGVVKNLKRSAEVTFSCNRRDRDCNFQFWVAGTESFYCYMEDCEFKGEPHNDRNVTTIQCTHMSCKCIPGRTLCGEPGSIDLSDWMVDPDEGPTGPTTYQCTELADDGGNRTCTFAEPHMNDLISLISTEPHFTLACVSGECLHVTQVPGYTRPSPPSTFSPLAIGLMIALGLGFVLCMVFGILWLQSRSELHQFEDIRSASPMLMDDDGEETIRLREEDAHRRAMMTGHIPVSVMFKNLSYTILSSPKNNSQNASKWSRWPFLKSTAASSVEDEEQQQALLSGYQCDGEINESNEDGATPSATGHRKIKVLNNVHGLVKPGQVMAIMGGSGAGKTTLLDILAKKSKRGRVKGDLLINGKSLTTEEYRSIIGYVDQEDTLMDTLTVSESIMYSALLRLPRTMTYEEKQRRVHATMEELGILHIANRRIGSAGSRGISGGEKKRVSIACELVTSPSILFLDEPTSGLDSYNAFNVIECLVSLARTYQRTVIFTIHQPRSNIYALFDQLILLAKGQMVYSGPAQELAIQHFASLGFSCPLGFNIADYLIDITMHTQNEDEDETLSPQEEIPATTQPQHPDINLAKQSSTVTDASANEGFCTPDNISNHGEPSANVWADSSARIPLNDPTSVEIDGPLVLNRPRSTSSNCGNLPNSLENLAQAPLRSFQTRRKQNAFSNAPTSSNQLGTSSASHLTHQNHFAELVHGYERSPIFALIKEEIAAAVHQQQTTDSASGHSIRRSRSLASLRSNRSQLNLNTLMHLSPRSKVGPWVQFQILSGRTFRNLYRNPSLLMTHYLISVVVAGLCGGLFWQVKNDIGGFQNRMGLFFFICALFGFGCLSSMHAFASERLIFIKERANQYYQPITYFTSKILFDMLPLRVIPPIILGLICYNVVGLRSESVAFMLKFLLVLVLFNLTSAACCMMLSLIFRDASVATLIATLVMLFEMLFGGLLLNKGSIPSVFRWLQDLSFFNSALEALVVNEVYGLTLYETKFGLQIDVPGAVILQTFGFNYQGYWSDVKTLCFMAGVFLSIGFLWLQFVVKERR